MLLGHSAGVLDAWLGWAWLLTLVFSFFFTSVAANAIATTARNPVSGMTMLTMIISLCVLLKFGLSGTTRHVFRDGDRRNGVHGAVGIGQVITDLKTGYWIGSTPSAQEKVKFLGVVAAAIAVGIDHRDAGARRSSSAKPLPGDLRPVLASPQASIMKAMVEGFMSHQPIAYLSVRRRRHDRLDHGDARPAFPGLCPGNVSAAAN